MDVDNEPAPRPDDVIMGEEERKEEEPRAQEDIVPPVSTMAQVPLVTEVSAEKAPEPQVVEKLTKEKALVPKE